MTEAILTKALELHSKITSLKKEIDYIDKCIEYVQMQEGSLSQKPFVNIYGKHLVLYDDILLTAIRSQRFEKSHKLQELESEFSQL